MNTCPDYIVDLMHEQLDGEIDHEQQTKLDMHLADCPSCKEIMKGLEEATALLESAAPIQAPDGFVDAVMTRLPKEKKQVGVQRWLRRHPIIAAAAMFFVLMSVSVFSNYGNDQHFSVTKQPNLVVTGETVLVPAGEVVKGDVIVKNGNLRVEGEVDGNITVINGSKYMASTAVVTGEIEEIDKAFDWLWYKMKNTVKDILPSKQHVPEDS